MQHFSGNLLPDFPTCLMEMSLVLLVPREIYVYRSSSNVPCLPSFWKLLQNPHVWLTQNDAWTSKLSEHVVLLPFWLRNVLRATAAWTFWAPDFEKCSENGVFWAFRLRNVFRATTPCTFWTSELPKVVRESCVPTFLFPNVLRAPTACSFWTFPLPKLLRTWRGFSFLTSKSASRHNGMQFFISNLTRRLRTRFSVLRLLHLFAHLYLFSAHSLFFDSFSSLTLLTSALPSVHIVGSLTSKLPLSIVRIYACMYICISPCFLMIAGFISVLGD